jgi:spermidine dehydrogenase
MLRNRPFGRIAFANSDLAGIMDHRASILEAQRAAGQVMEAIGGSRTTKAADGRASS